MPSSSRNTWRGRRDGSLVCHHYLSYDRRTCPRSYRSRASAIAATINIGMPIIKKFAPATKMT